MIALALLLLATSLAFLIFFATMHDQREGEE